MQQLGPGSGTTGWARVQQLFQPALDMSSGRGEGQLEGRESCVESSAEHGGPNQIVSQQPGHPFFFCHGGGFAFELSQTHLSFEIAQVEFDVPAPAVESHQFLGRIIGVQTGKQMESLGAKPTALDSHDQQASLDRLVGAALLGLIVAAGRPTHLISPRAWRWAHQPSRPPPA